MFLGTSSEDRGPLGTLAKENDTMEPVSLERSYVIHRLPDRIAVVRLDPQSEVPRWAWYGSLTAVIRTPAELTIVCDQTAVPGDLTSELDWVALRLEGPLPFSMTGVLASLLSPLASQLIPVFVVSTFDTEYILVKSDYAQRAKEALQAEGHQVV
jgi:uncharacterized protein